MKWINPYFEEGSWYRGNLHTHTKVSDGGWSQEDALMAYQHMARQDFVVLTDHTKKTHPEEFKSISELRELYRDKEFTIIEGREESFGHHILAVNVPMIFDEDIIGKDFDDYAAEDYQKLINRIKAEGGLAYLAHPHWKYMDYWPADTVLKLKDVDGIEIINGDRFHKSVVADLAVDVWDEVLSAGRHIFAVANDDTHSPETFHVCWNVVKAHSNTPEGIVEALRAGSMYCSTGAEFERIETDGRKIILEGSRHSKFSNCIKYFRFVGRNGETLKLQAGYENIAEYEARGDETYVRAELTTNWGLSAFTQPFWLEK